MLLIGKVFCSTPKGIRTPVAAVKGQCPRPLDDGRGKARIIRRLRWVSRQPENGWRLVLRAICFQAAFGVDYSVIAASKAMVIMSLNVSWRSSAVVYSSRTMWSDTVQMVAALAPNSAATP